MKTRLPRLFAPLVLALTQAYSTRAQSTAFNYQGRLDDGGLAAAGTYDFQFYLRDALTGGNPIGPTNTLTQLGLSNGLFTVMLDFGNSPFTGGAPRWLVVAVRTNGGGVFAPLSPRQYLAAAPYSLYAPSAGVATFANDVVPSAILHAQALQIGVNNTMTTANATIAGGGNNTADGPYTSIGGGYQNIAIGNSASIGGGSGNRASGEYATVAGGENNAAVGTHAFVGGGSGNSASGYDVIGGGLSNTVTADTSGIGSGAGNLVSGYASWIGGGQVNRAIGNYCVIGGGYGNSNSSTYATLGGGQNNNIRTNSIFATIAGGQQNVIGANAGAATIAGGFVNTIESGAGPSAISGGNENRVQSGATYCAMGGGLFNTIQTNAAYSVIGGGNGNTIRVNTLYSTIGGGILNTIQANAYDSTIGGGGNNTIQTNATYSTIGGGEYHTIQASAHYAAIGGGYLSTIETNAEFATIGGGGSLNTIQASSAYSTVSGGKNNVVGDYLLFPSTYAVIAGGEGNTVGPYIGIENFAPGDHSAIGGGYSNKVWGIQSVISGGASNLISGGYWSTIAGGANNSANLGQFSAVPGGQNNEADGDWSFAAGQRAKAYHSGTFVWADSQPADFASTTNDQFNIRARGGVRLSSGTSLQWSSGGALVDNQGGSIELGDSTESAKIPFIDFHYGIGSAQDYNVRIINDGTEQLTIARYGSVTPMARLSPGGMTVNGALVLTSDRNQKENFEQVDAGDVLAKVVALPLTKWNYKEDTSSTHIGPMAQDFYAAFAVGPDDKHIATVDADGVALAAIQGLNLKLTEQLAQRDAENTELKKRLEKVENFMREFTPK